MAKTIAQLGYDNFNIAGEVQEGLPSAYDFELYVENNTIKTKGYNILTNNKVTVENNAMKFAGGIDSYLTLDPEILNATTDFIIEFKFKPTAKPAEDSISGIIHFGRIPSGNKNENEFGINILWSKKILYADMWNVEYGSTMSDVFPNPLSLPFSSNGDINITDEFITVKLVRINGFLAIYINGTFKKGYRSIGTFAVDSIVVGCENDVKGSSSLVNLDANQAFTGYIEYIKIKNFKTTTLEAEPLAINYKNFSIQPTGNINIETLTEGYQNFASSKSLYYLPDALKTNTDTLALSAIGDLSTYKTVEGGTITGSIKATDIIDLTRENSKNSVRLTKTDFPTYLWDWKLHDDAYSMKNWSYGYNGGVNQYGIGYHAKWVKEGPNSKICIKFIDMNKQTNIPHRWLGVSYPIATSTSSVISYAVGDKLTIHFKAKGLFKDSIVQVGFYRTQISTGTSSFGSQLKNITLTENWEEYSVSFTVDQDWDTTKACGLYIYGNVSKIETITWVSDVILSKNLETNMTSEQLYNLNNNGIKFNLSKDIGLDWSKPWTICYWRKPLCEASSKYNLDSIGSNNSKLDNRGYIYLGGANAENRLAIRLDNSLIYTTVINEKNINYYSNWTFNCIKYDGTNLTAFIRGEKFNEFKATCVPSTPVTANYYDSGYGYDLLLGGYDNNNAAGTIYKDLLIAKNAIISDEDLDYIYRTKINYNNGALTSNTNFKETL